jgi:hypothetical protein
MEELECVVVAARPSPHNDERLEMIEMTAPTKAQSYRARASSVGAGLRRATAIVLVACALPFAGSLIGVASISSTLAVAQQAPFLPITEDQIKSFIAADADVAAVTSKMPEGMEKPDAAFQAQLDAAARKHSFKDFDQYITVANNIAAVLAGLDPDTGEYSDPRPSIDKQIAALKADTQVPKEDKDALLTELEDLKKIAVPIEHKGNIPLVQKYRAALQQLQ